MRITFTPLDVPKKWDKQMSVPNECSKVQWGKVFKEPNSVFVNYKFNERDKTNANKLMYVHTQ